MKLIDVFMAFLVVVGGVQFVYCVLAGNYVSLLEVFSRGGGASVAGDHHQELPPIVTRFTFPSSGSSYYLGHLH